MSDNPILPRPYTAPPITVPITTAPVQVQVGNPPYTVINLSSDTDDTIWLADNPAVQVNQGTPLYPGTSLLWNRHGRLWAVGESAATMLVSYDVTDWEPNPVAIATAILNSGTLLIDKPVQLGVFEQNDGVLTQIFDTARYQSVLAFIQPFAATVYPATDKIRFVFEESTTSQPFADRVLHFHNSSTDWYGSFPLLGNQLTVVRDTDDSKIAIWASNRLLPYIHTPYNTLAGNLESGNVLLAHAVNIAAAGTQTYFLPPFHGNIAINAAFIANAAAATSTLTISHSIDGALRNMSATVYPAPLGPGTVSDLRLGWTLSGEAARLSINNTDAAARLHNILVTSEGTAVAGR